MGVAVVVVLLAVELWVAIAVLDTGVEAAWVPWLQVALFVTLAVEVAASWQFIRRGHHEVAYAIASCGLALIGLLAMPLFLGW